MTTWAAPASYRTERADSRRVVAITVMPMRTPRRTAIRPTAEVPPRTRIMSPLRARIAWTSEPYAVCVISGIAPIRSPVQVGREGNCDALGDQGVARVGAVVLAAKTAHHEGDLLAGLESTARSNFIDDANPFNSKDPRIREIRVGETPTRVGLRLVDAKSFDAHAHPAIPHLRDGELRDRHLADLAGTFEADDVHQGSISFHRT